MVNIHWAEACESTIIPRARRNAGEHPPSRGAKGYAGEDLGVQTLEDHDFFIFSAAKLRSRHRALSKWGVVYELGVLRRLQASIQFV